jgi:hypothetical protein
LPWITIRSVSLVPSELPCYPDHDDNVLRTSPGLYPDLLTPMENGDIVLVPEQWRALWITVNPAREQIKPGIYPIEIVVHKSFSEQELSKAIFHLRVIDELLPKQILVHTEWFHADCIATYYGLEVFSEGHWERMDQFIQTAVKHGINMILTPLFTPPLDTVSFSEFAFRCRL